MLFYEVNIAINEQWVHIELNYDLAPELYLRSYSYLIVIVWVTRVLEIIYYAQQNCLNTMNSQNHPFGECVTSKIFKILSMAI